MARRLEGCSCEGVEGEPVCGEPTAHGCGGSGGISVVGAAAGGAVGAFGGEGGAAPGDGGRQGGLVLFRLRIADEEGHGVVVVGALAGGAGTVCLAI